MSSYPFLSRLVVGAPQEVKAANQTGGLYQCDYSTGRCEAAVDTTTAGAEEDVAAVTE